MNKPTIEELENILNGKDSEIEILPSGEITTRTKRLESCLRDILDAFWDMSPLEYAQSRGLPNMSDEIGMLILKRARNLLDSRD